MNVDNEYKCEICSVVYIKRYQYQTERFCGSTCKRRNYKWKHLTPQQLANKKSLLGKKNMCKYCKLEFTLITLRRTNFCGPSCLSKYKNEFLNKN